MKVCRINTILLAGLFMLTFFAVSECMAMNFLRGRISGGEGGRPSRTSRYPAAVYYADVEGGYPYRHANRVDPYEDDYALILPNKGNSPFAYRRWNERMTYGTGAIDFGSGFGAYDGYSTGAARSPYGSGLISGARSGLNYPDTARGVDGRGLFRGRLGASFGLFGELGGLNFFDGTRGVFGVGALRGLFASPFGLSGDIVDVSNVTCPEGGVNISKENQSFGEECSNCEGISSSPNPVSISGTSTIDIPNGVQNKIQNIQQKPAVNQGQTSGTTVPSAPAVAPKTSAAPAVAPKTSAAPVVAPKVPVAAPAVAPKVPAVAPAVAPKAPVAAPAVAPKAPVAAPAVAPKAPVAAPAVAPKAPVAAPAVAPKAPVAAPAVAPKAPVAAPAVAPKAPVVAPAVAPKVPAVAPAVAPKVPAAAPAVAPKAPAVAPKVPSVKNTKLENTFAAKGYSVSAVEGAYNQEFVYEGDVAFGGEYITDYGFYETAPRGCGLFRGLKKLLTGGLFCGKSCLSRVGGGVTYYAGGIYDPCGFSCDPCGFSCYDPCCFPCDPCMTTCDPCGGASFGTFYGGGFVSGVPQRSCCGADEGNSSFYTGDSGATFDSRSASGNLPGPSTVETSGGIDAAASQKSVPTPVNQPAVPTQPKPQGDNVPTPVPGTGGAPRPNLPGTSGMIQMTVPEDSVVYVNGYKTHLTGKERNFTAKDLVPGETYDFEIKVVYAENGQEREMVKNTSITPGSSAYLAFDFQNLDNIRTVALNK